VQMAAFAFLTRSSNAREMKVRDLARQVIDGTFESTPREDRESRDWPFMATPFAMRRVAPAAHRHHRSAACQCVARDSRQRMCGPTKRPSLGA
jgi:hypothetical protein